ncbi:MAG: hypothetical protein KDD38_01885 [Bdellovibrionales bacterium]|nr:hypothetical protein [Bdellovibrionales bacterium]
MDSLKEMTFFKSESSSSELANQFQMLLDKFCAHIKKEGLANVTSYTQDSLDRFHTLPSDKKITIIKNFHDYYELCVECVAAGISLKDGRKMLWKLLPTLGLRPTSDLFDNLHDDHVIEVYRPDFTQVFRNIKFLELCSYPIADLYIQPWTELFDRPQQITNSIIKSIQKCLSTGTATSCDVPVHELYERSSSMNQILKIEQGRFSPLFDKFGKPAAFVGTLNATIISRNITVNSNRAATKQRSLHLEEKLP